MSRKTNSTLQRWRMNASTVLEILRLFSTQGRYWLIPMVLVLLMSSFLLVALQVAEYVAPFVYTMF